MIDAAYVVNVIFWMSAFGLAGAILHYTVKAFGITVGLGGSMFILLSILQDGLGAGPTFLNYIPFTSPFRIVIPSWFISIVLFMISLVAMFFVERSFHAEKTY